MTVLAPLIEAIHCDPAALLYLDYGGTFVPLRQWSAHHGRPALDVAVISGRSLRDLRAASSLQTLST